MNTLRRAMHPIFAALALLTLVPTAHADPPPNVGAQRVYLGDGRTLTVSAPKLLTFTERVGSFAIQPGSRDVAYAGSDTSGQTPTQCVWMVDIVMGNTRTLLSNNGPNSGINTLFSYQLTAWSGDGRYLIVSHTEHKDAVGTLPERDGRVWDSVNTSMSPITVRRIPLFETGGEERRIAPVLVPSPSGTLFAVAHDRPIVLGKPAPTVVFIYDPATDTMSISPLPTDTLLLGWNDDTHLLLFHSLGGSGVMLLRDIFTGKDAPATKPREQSVPSASILPGVTLSFTQTVRDMTSMGKPSTVATVALYLHVTAGKRELPPLLLGGSFLSHNTNAVLAPDQSSAVWIQNGDLYASTFAVVPATDADKARS